MREIRTYGLKRGPPHRQHLGGVLYSTLRSGVCGAVGGMMVIELLAGTMRLDRGGIAAGEMREWKLG